MNKFLKLSLVAFAIVVGTLLLMAGAGTGPRYVGRFFGDGTGLSNSVDLVEGPNILITPGPGNRAYTIESTAAGAAGIFTNSIMGYGDEYRTNYVRISSIGVTVNSGALISDRLVVLDGAASNYVAGDTTFLGSLFIAGVESSGTIFTSDVFQGNGISITNIDGTEIRSGTVADARIASTIARDTEVTTATQNSTNAGNIVFKPANNVFTGSNYFTAPVVVNTNLVVNAGGNLTALGTSNRVDSLYSDMLTTTEVDAENFHPTNVFMHLITNTNTVGTLPIPTNAAAANSAIQGTSATTAKWTTTPELKGLLITNTAAIDETPLFAVKSTNDNAVFHIPGTGVVWFGTNGFVHPNGNMYAVNIYPKANNTGYLGLDNLRWTEIQGTLVEATNMFAHGTITAALTVNATNGYTVGAAVGIDKTFTLYTDDAVGTGRVTNSIVITKGIITQWNQTP